MALAICFRYGGREYYKELGVGDEVSFGSHKKESYRTKCVDRNRLQPLKIKG